MTPKIISAIVTFLINIAIGVVVFAGMIVAMNGYGESDATWGIGAFILLALIVTLLMSIGAFLVAGQLTKKQFGAVSASIIAILIFSIVGGVLKFICSLIGVGVAEFVRVKF